MNTVDPILDQRWPSGLDPKRAGFRRRTETILRRMGVWADMRRLDELAEAVVLGWENAGAKTVEDLRVKANAAIVTYHDEVRRREAEQAEQLRINEALVDLAGEAWTARVWRRDPRSGNLSVSVTV